MPSAQLLPGLRGQAHPRSALVCPQPAAAVQMFQSLEALDTGAVGRINGSSAGLPAGAALGTVAPGGPAGGGMGATHSGPAGPELP